MSIYECQKCGKIFDEEEIEYDRVKLYTFVKIINGKEQFIEVNRDEGKCPYCGQNYETIKEVDE
jgi:DNA-directed RNA polymerase subunit RPC12/RpoP